MKTFALVALSAAVVAVAASPAAARPYKLDRLHDRENRVQDAVDQNHLPRSAGDELIAIRKLEAHMRARHRSNLTTRDFAILNARLDALHARYSGHTRRHTANGRRAGAGASTTITTTTTTIRR